MIDNQTLLILAQSSPSAPTPEKKRKRRIQRNGFREPTGKPRGRPRLTEAEAIDSKAKRLEYRRAWFRSKRANKLCGAPDAIWPVNTQSPIGRARKPEQGDKPPHSLRPSNLCPRSRLQAHKADGDHEEETQRS
jgi:hypothetical protein